MPNYKVFQDDPKELRTRVYGVDNGTDQALKVDANGAVAIQDDGGSITVDAADLDIRDLDNSTDNVLVYGTDGVGNQPLRTDANGVLQVASVSAFMEQTESVTTSSQDSSSTAHDVSLVPNYTWFISNHTGNSASIKLQISPNNSDWIDASIEQVVAGHESMVLVPTIFLRYTRLTFRSTAPGQDTNLSLTLQAFGG